MEVKTNSILPKGDMNGLHSLASELAREVRGDSPIRTRAVIGVFRPRRVSQDTDGTETVTIEFGRVEPLLIDDLPRAETLLRRALEKRLGVTVLPLEIEELITEAFDAALQGDEEPDPPEGGRPLKPDDEDGDGEPNEE